MEDFNWHFGNFTTEMQTLAYREFTSTDSEYKEIEYYLNKHSDAFDKVLNQLNQEHKKFAKDYIDKQNYQASSVRESLYLAGYRDCVRLLKELGVL